MITTLIICISVIAAFYLGFLLGRASYTTEHDLRQELQRMIEDKERLTIQPVFRAHFSSQDLKDLREAYTPQNIVNSTPPLKRKRGRPRKNPIK
jgi:hypothetical protein